MMICEENDVLQEDAKCTQLKRTSWLDSMRRDEGSRPSSCDSSLSSTDTDDNKRELSLEFINGVNEEKFERLIKQEKIKSSFKRRHSNGVGNHSNSSLSSSEGDHECNNKDKQQQSSRQNNYFNDLRSKLCMHREEKRIRHNSCNSSTSSSSNMVESDPAILARRQKQIDYGKNTTAYDRYIDLVPKSKRTRDHPETPNKYGKYSRRAFDGLIKIWRKQLHSYDDPEADAANADSTDDSDE